MQSQKRVFAGWARVALCAGVLGLAVSAPAVGPHELVVVMNADSGDSMLVARTYARLRSIPAGNLIPVSIPPRDGRFAFEMSAEDFTRHVWQPVREALIARALDDQVLAWVYSVDIPLRISTDPPVSIQGLTFVRNRLPPAGQIRDGSWPSPLYAGEGMVGRPGFAPQTLDSYARWLGPEMPLPSMILGVTFPGGNAVDQIIAALRRGLESDGTHPDGTVYFVTSEDIRSRCRAWQFPAGARALRQLGVRVSITNALPRGATDVIGLMMGSDTVDPTAIGRFLPGAAADHLTSFAGDFSHHQQTKLTRWIAAGATASAGTVTEPMSIAAKFPAARFYAFYASGCTLIESYAQAVQSPLQLVTVGDPLAAPWSPRVAFELSGLPESGLLAAPVEVKAVRVPGTARMHVSRSMFFINGTPAGAGSRIRLDPADFDPGAHEIRFVAWRTGLVQSQVFVRAEFSVE